jgi:hypothetical protein
LWDFLSEQPDVAGVLFNPRTTKHMGEVLSKKVRNELETLCCSASSCPWAAHSETMA